MLRKISSKVSTHEQSNRRHHVRKIKAKIRALLPQEICQHHKKRNHRVQNIEQHESQCSRNINQFFSSFGSQNRMIANYQSAKLPGKYYYSKDEKIRQKLFDKLSKQQIEQIKQNKFYFLGNEENIKLFENYLQQNKQNDPHKFQPQQPTSFKIQRPLFQSNTINNFITSGVFYDQENRNIARKQAVSAHQTSLKNLLDFSRASKPSTSMHRIGTQSNVRTKQHIKENIERKKIIDEDDQQKKKIDTKHIIRQQKIAEQRKNIKLNTKISLIRKHNMQQQVKSIVKLQAKNANRQEFGQINDICENLRQICLKRQRSMKPKSQKF